MENLYAMFQLKKFKFLVLFVMNHLTEIHRNSLRKVEWILNRPIIKFYNSVEVNANTAKLHQAKTRQISF